MWEGRDFGHTRATLRPHSGHTQANIRVYSQVNIRVYRQVNIRVYSQVTVRSTLGSTARSQSGLINIGFRAIRATERETDYV